MSTYPVVGSTGSRDRSETYVTPVVAEKFALKYWAFHDVKSTTTFDGSGVSREPGDTTGRRVMM